MSDIRIGEERCTNRSRSSSGSLSKGTHQTVTPVITTAVKVFHNRFDSSQKRHGRLS